MSRVALAAATVVVALAGAVGVVAFFQARDDAQLETSGSAPGMPADEDDPRLRAGNVILTYREEADGRTLRALAEDVAGPPDDALVDAGQAVIVLRRPDQGAGPVVGHALRRRLVSDRGDDPEVRRFVEYWLGRASGS